MTKLSGTARRMDSGFRRNDRRGRHPGESRDPQRPVSARQRATVNWVQNLSKRSYRNTYLALEFPRCAIIGRTLRVILKTWAGIKLQTTGRQPVAK